MTRLALIGAGRWGTNILRTLGGLRGVVVDVLGPRDDKNPASPRLRGIQGVLIATPAATHAAIARPFIERGIPTFVEKPFTTSLHDARLLERVARKSRAIVFVGHVHLYNPAYVTARAHAQRAGRIRLLVAEGMNNGPYRDDSSALWDWGPHHLAMALDLLGKPPVAVQAWGVSTLRPKTPLHDLVVLRMRFPRGAAFVGTTSWLAPEKRMRLTIVGARNTVVFDDAAEKKVTVYQGLGPTVRRGRVTRREPTVSRPQYSDVPPLRRELEAFLQCLRTGKKPPTDAAQGVTTVRILDAAERSIARGGHWITNGF